MLDVNSPTSVALFKKQALEKGYKPEEVDSYLQQKQSVVQPSAIANNPLVQVTKNIPIVGSVVGEASGLVDRAVRKTGEAGAKLAIQNSPEYKRLSKKADDGTMTGEEALRFEELNKPLFLSQNETERLSNPVTNFTDQSKDLAATAAFAIPGAKTVPGAAAVGAGRAMLGSYGTSKKELNDPTLYSDVVSSAPTGALLEGGLTYAGNKLSKKLNKPKTPSTEPNALETTGNEMTNLAYKKSFKGVPKASEGGVKAFDEWNKAGMNVSNPDALAKSADDILASEGGALHQAVKDAAVNGVGVDKNKVIGYLQDKIDEIRIPELKAPYQKALESVKNAYGNSENIPLDFFYADKQSYGKLGSWNPLDATKPQEVAAAYEDLYHYMNKLMDEALKSNGFDNLRPLNQKISKALAASNFAERMGAKYVPNSPFGLMDATMAGAGALATGGNPLGAATGVAINKTINSPETMKAAGGILKRAGSGIRNLPNVSIPEGAVPAISKGVNMGLSMEQPSQAPSTEPSAGLEISNATGQDVESYIQERTGFKPLTLSNVIKLAGGNKANYDMLKQIYDEQQKVRAEYGKTVGGQNTGALAMVSLAQQKFNELQAKGLTGVVGGQAGAVGAATQLSPESRVYKDMILAIITPIARALGEKGVISDRDIPRYAPLLPPLNSTPEVARQKWDDIKYLIQASSKSSGMTSTDLGNASQVAF